MSADQTRRRCVTDLGDLERAQADGQITTGDADEVRRFAAFLADVGPDKSSARAAYAEHYPEETR